MANQSYTAKYEALSKVVKIIIQIFLGGIVGGIFRIVRYFETKNIETLIVGLLCTFTGIGNVVAWVVDLYTEITENKIKYFAD